MNLKFFDLLLSGVKVISIWWRDLTRSDQGNIGPHAEKRIQYNCFSSLLSKRKGEKVCFFGERMLVFQLPRN